MQEPRRMKNEDNRSSMPPARRTDEAGTGLSSFAGRLTIDVSCLVPRPLTGVGYYTRDLLRSFLARHTEWRMRLFASSAKPAGDLAQELGVEASTVRTLRLPTRLKNGLWTRLEWPPITAFTGDADIVHGAFHLLPASRRARRIATVFDLSALRFPGTRPEANLRLHLGLLRHAVARADALIAISESCRNDLIDLLHASPERVFVVYGGVSLDEFTSPLDDTRLKACRERFGLTGEYLVHLGTLEPRKNLPRLLEAYARVYARRRDCPRLVLAGHAGWMYDDVFETIERLGLRTQVVVTGYLERADAVCLLRGAFACVYPSLYEGFGLPVLEAMAARTPVLTSNVSSLPEVIGKEGILVEPENVDSIEAGLEEIIEHHEEALARAERAFERACTFTWTRSADVLAEAYRRVLERPKR